MSPLPSPIRSDKWKANRIIVSSVENDGLVPVADFDERQRLKQLEDDLVDVRLVLDSTLDTVESMLENYMELSSTQHQTEDEIDAPTMAREDLIVRLLQEQRQDIRLLKTKVEALCAKVAGTTELVSHQWGGKTRFADAFRFLFFSMSPMVTA